MSISKTELTKLINSICPPTKEISMFCICNASPEKQLWVHVILRSVMDIVLYIENASPSSSTLAPKVLHRNYIYAKEAKQWVLSDNNKRHSFIWCVETCFKYEYCDFIVTSIRKLARSITPPKRLKKLTEKTIKKFSNNPIQY